MNSDVVIFGRFAPSPSGRMHLGNIFTALMSWLSVRSRNGKWILRIEDLDPQRSSMENAKLIEDDLHWLGIDWDEGGIDNNGLNGPYLQSQRHHLYKEALNRLHLSGLTYPCHCSRADIMSVRAPHQSDGRIVYSGKCRPKILPQKKPFHIDQPAAIRIFVPDNDIIFDDLICGQQRVNLTKNCGDFILRRKDGAWAYMLAVVIDDALMGITEVMRGNDLLLSAAQQIYIYRLLGFTPPVFAHLPLICNSKGIRLSKRDQSLSMEFLRREYSANQIIGLLAGLAGFNPSFAPATPAELIPYFSITHLTKTTSIILPDNLNNLKNR